MSGPLGSHPVPRFTRVQIMKPIRKAIFPDGGLGTRFPPATKAMPKEMLPEALARDLPAPGATRFTRFGHDGRSPILANKCRIALHVQRA